MRANHLAVVFPMKKLPQNTEKIPVAVWAETCRLLRRNMGKLYAAFYPAVRPWDINIRTPFSVVLGRADPSGFLGLYFRAREKRDLAIEYHVGGTIAENGFDKLHKVGDTLFCPVSLDGTNKSLEAHIFWQMALANGVILPDCGVYYAEWMRSTVEPNLEKVIESSPEDYALCMVTLEHVGGCSHGV